MKHTIAITALLFCLQVSYAQQTRYITDPETTFYQAREYFQKEQYSLAYPLFKDLQLQQRETDRSNNAIDYQDVNYYKIVCALKQNEEAATQKAKDFIIMTENAPRVQMMSFHLAEYYFRKQDYTEAITLYENANLDNLSNHEIADMKFHLGYAYFSQDKMEQAKPLFNTIRQMPDDPNYMAANYYYGFIAFADQEYGEALEAFKVVEDDPAYSSVIPYYIATIYYAQGQKEEALKYAEAKLKTGNQYYDLELRQLVGHAYFEKKEFDKALPYLEAYVSKSEKVRREDMYELSYCYYQASNWNKAIEGFKQLSGKEDSLAQNAMYMLGDAYLKTNQKANARNAFLFCSTNSSNELQREISMFNYAKLSYELGYQDVAITELQKFLQTYPSSSYSNEAKELLVAVLAGTSNYKDALTLLESLQSPSPSARRLYPKILYGRATELINDGMLVTANDLLTRAEKDPNNGSVLPFVQFWKGEIAYRLNKIDDAQRYYLDYLKSGRSEGEANPTNAKYNLGYCFLRKENYDQALNYFKSVAGTPGVGASSIQQDAYVRAADCYYMNRNYSQAVAMYNKVLSYSWPTSDYATFQKGMIAGVSNPREKVNLLSSIDRLYPTSSLVPDANMEIANAYLVSEDYNEAIPFLQNVINDPDAGSLQPRAYLRLGLAYYNVDKSDEALKQYSALLQKYPNSSEAAEALENARVIYVEQGRSSEYVAFARSMGKDISASQEDQLAYQEAEVQFNNGNFTAAAQKFEQYLEHFPNGQSALEALYYKSEIYYNQKNWEKAAAGYEAVADRAPNKFGEKSTLLAARLNYFDLKNYDKAEKYFTELKGLATSQENKLESMRGLLRSQYELQKWPEAVENARDLLAQKGIGTDDKVLANMAIAKSYQVNSQYAEAITSFKAVAGLNKSAYSAEARYEIAACYFKQNELKDAEKAAFEVINKSGSYETWVTKAYILLGDIYFEEKDYFNAKATYRSVADNAGIETLRQEAQQKLAAVEAAEQKGSKLNDDN